LYNLGLLLKDATVVQNACVAASAASSTSPDVDLVSVKDPCGGDISHSKAKVPLPSVEEKLRVLDAALVALERLGLRATEISRLHNIIQGVKVYQQLFADFVNCKHWKLNFWR
jgi:hypothetical protein